VGQFRNIINRFVEATAVLIVTTCLIPLLVALFFGWLIKTLFGVQILLPAPPPARRCGKKQTETDMSPVP
jgi:hypothetical protein